MKTTTITTIVLAGILAFSLAGCSKSEAPTPKISERTDPPKAPQPQQPTPPTLDQEALALAEKGFLEPWTQVGDSWFTWWRRTGNISGGETSSCFIQIRGLTNKVEPQRLSEAETLNGLQWKGEVQFLSRIYRKYRLEVSQWSDWTDGQPGFVEILLPIYHLTKKNGQWTIDFVAGGEKERLTKPSEEQIKKILPQ
jgi:hypothetical protein